LFQSGPFMTVQFRSDPSGAGFPVLWETAGRILSRRRLMRTPGRHADATGFLGSSNGRTLSIRSAGSLIGPVRQSMSLSSQSPCASGVGAFSSRAQAQTFSIA
jgi:hypothetical protein